MYVSVPKPPIINLKSTNFPQEVLDIAKNLIVDISGVTIAGSTTKSAKLFYALAEEIYSLKNEFFLDC